MMKYESNIEIESKNSSETIWIMDRTDTNNWFWFLKFNYSKEIMVITLIIKYS